MCVCVCACVCVCVCVCACVCVCRLLSFVNNSTWSTCLRKSLTCWMTRLKAHTRTRALAYTDICTPFHSILHFPISTSLCLSVFLSHSLFTGNPFYAGEIVSSLLESKQVTIQNGSTHSL